MGAWYVMTVWVHGTCGVRDSGVVGSSVCTVARASKVKGFGSVDDTGCAIVRVLIGVASGDFRQ